MANDNTKTWPELAVSLYDKLTGRNAEITYEFKDFDLYVPSAADSSDSEQAHWRMNGILKVTTTDGRNNGQSAS